MNIRPFDDSDADYAALVDLNRRLEPERHFTAAALRAEDREQGEHHRLVRFLGEVDGAVVAAGVHWLRTDEPGAAHHFALAVHPDHQTGDVPRLMQAHLLARMEAEKPVAIASEPKEDETYRIHLLEGAGFSLRMRFPRSMLDVTGVDCTAYDPLFARLAGEGIRFVTLTHVITEDPEWQHNIWRMFTAIDRDIPSPEPYAETPFEEYAAYYRGDDYRPDSWAIAIDTSRTGVERYVGMCVVNLMSTRPDGLFAGITGVISSHRRRGIATGLKVRSIAYAQANGFRRIYTDNEESNPMYDLNRKLGFQPLPAWLYYRRETT